MPKGDVYWDSTRKVWSVKQNGKVVLKSTYLLVENAEFVVNETARQRVLTTGKKTPHAFIRGFVYEGRLTRAKRGMTTFGYNPRVAGEFRAGDKPLKGAKLVALEAGLHPRNYAVGAY